MDNPSQLIFPILFIAVIAAVGVYFFKLPKTATETAQQPEKTATLKDTGTTMAKINSIYINDYQFAPAKITIKLGSTVTWTNMDKAKHTITADTLSQTGLNSPEIGTNESYQYTFNETGSFGYHCTPHPYMKGVIEVVESSTP